MSLTAHKAGAQVVSCVVLENVKANSVLVIVCGQRAKTKELLELLYLVYSVISMKYYAKKFWLQLGLNL